MTDLAAWRGEVRDWCADHVPSGWRSQQLGASQAEQIAFQRWWFAELRAAGWAVPHWPKEWGGGLSVAEQVVLYQELAAFDAPRLSLAFVAIHHAAATLLAAGNDEQRRRHLPAILDGELWAQGFSEPEAGSDLASLRTAARLEGDTFVVDGQKLWSSGARHADWCLLLARTDPVAPKHRGISFLLLELSSPGVEIRPIRNAIGDDHFCEVFLDRVVVPVANLIGPLHGGWQVAQSTLSAERGMTMLELSERLEATGLRLLVERCRIPGPDGSRPIDSGWVADRLAGLAAEVAGLRRLCLGVVERAERGALGPADPSIAKLVYSELLQRTMDFGTEVAGLDTFSYLGKPMASGWESGAWALDFVGSWEWTIPGGSSEIQRTIIAERGLGLPREQR